MSDNQNIPEVDNQQKKKYKTFKEYYADPDFKAKHLQKVNVKVTCECGAEVSKCNLSNHKKTQKHALKMEIKNKEQ